MGMNREPIETTIKLRLIVRPFELTCENITKDQLDTTVKDFLSLAESHSEQISRVISKFSVRGVVANVAGTIKEGLPVSKIGSLSIAELVKQTGRKKGTDVALIIAYYLFKERGLQVINTKDLGDAYEEARMSKLSNPTDTLNKLVSAGRVKSAGEKETLNGYTITQTGEGVVDEWLGHSD